MGKIALKRTSLYASGASPVNLLQARFYNEDCLVYDLEDSVPVQEKDAIGIQIVCDLHLGLQDAFPAAQIFKMRDTDIGDHSYDRAGRAGQSCDLAKMVHAHFHNGCFVGIIQFE